MIEELAWFHFGPTGRTLLAWALMALVLALFTTAIVHDAHQRRWLWLILDIAVPPLGVVRGILVWFEKV